MTKESMIKVLRYKAEHIKTRIKPEFFLEVADALEQHPCEDAISRQAALDIYDDYNVAVENGELEAYRKHRKRLLKLPPVQPKTGHWIHLKHDKGKCSECHDVVLIAQMYGNANYCPNCGAKMEPQESENKK
jgi:NADH pyrophosphatase NudC (nudix superfamily)